MSTSSNESAYDYAPTIYDQISVVANGSDQFQSRYRPARMGNMADLAYGGCALGVGLRSACETVSPQFALYSVTGSFLAPVSTAFQLQCVVRRLRDTKTFATRQVEVKQEQKDGTTRLCMIILADFQKAAESSLLTYSALPGKEYSLPDKCLSPFEAGEKMVHNRELSEESLTLYKSLFGLMHRFFEFRQAPEGIAAHNLSGVAKHRFSDQDDLDLPQKTSADWFRSRQQLPSPNDQYAAFIFMMDGFLSFLPLAHNKMFLDDAAACSSLDFALRLFTVDMKLEDWHLRELRTLCGANGRTFSESRVWDQHGTLIASMTQQSILRPKGDVPARL
ncbi:acyl-CoA thioesterase II [Fusarium redolens]|uniref:Acyl-CoA thioesterase II n=1 Tax=Fusarium redolens TaxID=48865 RepID=A0A9P9FW10_FUSRE|nr:acyl-CoA thioesterase II [Fusarium redolens]KAH7203123.1 acyl-CoA thioesterase II [Fusarium redolens]